MTNYTDFYYSNPESITTTEMGMSYTTTTDTPNQTWYYYDPDGELIQSDGPPQQQHTHEMPSHNHSFGGNTNWQIQVPKNDGLFHNGEEIMKYNGDVQFKVNDEWISVDDLSLRIKTLEVITERLYNMLSPWQKKKLDVDRMDLEDKKDEFEHFDPDLFKV